MKKCFHVNHVWVLWLRALSFQRHVFQFESFPFLMNKVNSSAMRWRVPLAVFEDWAYFGNPTSDRFRPPLRWPLSTPNSPPFPCPHLSEVQPRPLLPHRRVRGGGAGPSQALMTRGEGARVGGGGVRRVGGCVCEWQKPTQVASESPLFCVAHPLGDPQRSPHAQDPRIGG